MNREEQLDLLVSSIGTWDHLNGMNNGGWAFIDNQLVHTLHDPITIDDWNRAKIKAGTKIKIESPEHSEYVQKLAFENGFYRPSMRGVGAYKDSDFLFFWSINVISYSTDDAYFKEHEHKEIFVEMPHPDINARVLAEKVGSKHSAVTNPKHYEVMGGIEAIQVIASSMTLEQWKGYCLGNILKYRLRAGKKDDINQDINKANEYEMLHDKYSELCKDS